MINSIITPVDRSTHVKSGRRLTELNHRNHKIHSGRNHHTANDRVELGSNHSSTVHDPKHILGHITNSQRLYSANKNYHSYEQVNLIMEKLAEAYPEQTKLVSLGKTLEGRDIMALRISNNEGREASQKPGVVITGATHAREWPTPEIALNTATSLLQGYSINPDMKNRVNNADIWIIPVVNPDGFSYSHTQNDMWRKNRRPIEQTACDLLPKPSDPQQRVKMEKTLLANKIKAYGVDINRNFYDGNPDHYYLYRPAGDTPCSTRDDFGASDDPRSEAYRGISGASELETRAMINFELNTPNLKGVLDFHSYSELILFPWGHKTAPVENEQEYLELGKKMQSVTETEYKAFPRRTNQPEPIIHADRCTEATALTQYKLMPSHDLYPTCGSSNDMHHINGIMGFTMEMGTSFHPSDKARLDNSINNGTRASMVFIDHFIEKNRKTR